jgi:hypothetical protein
MRLLTKSEKIQQVEDKLDEMYDRRMMLRKTCGKGSPEFNAVDRSVDDLELILDILNMKFADEKQTDKEGN